MKKITISFISGVTLGVIGTLLLKKKTNHEKLEDKKNYIDLNSLSDDEEIIDSITSKEVLDKITSEKKFEEVYNKFVESLERDKILIKK